MGKAIDLSGSPSPRSRVHFSLCDGEKNVRTPGRRVSRSVLQKAASEIVV